MVVKSLTTEKGVDVLERLGRFRLSIFLICATWQARFLVVIILRQGLACL